MARILVTGANGLVSTATITALKGMGHQVIGLVRDRLKGERLGIEFRLGELDRPRSLEGAFEGIDTAFLLTAPTSSTSMAGRAASPSAQYMAPSWAMVGAEKRRFCQKKCG